MKKFAAQPGEPLAIEHRALGAEYEEPMVSAPTTSGSLAVVRVQGPLLHRANLFFESYEDILAQVGAACADHSVSAIGLVIDSPGGLTSGLFETANQIRRFCDDAGKPLHAYAEGTCASAAYALACVADTVTVASTALTGSVGVISVRADISENLRAAGVRVEFVTSGSTKAYGSPELPLTDTELADQQRIVDSLAEVFFTHVRAHRGIEAAPLDARVFVGGQAVQAGLADRVSTYAQWIGEVTDPDSGVSGMTYAELIEALGAMAEGDGEDADQAKKALAAISAEDKEDEEKAEDGKSDEDKSDDEEDDEPKAIALVAKLAAQVAELSAKLEASTASKEESDRAAFFASRPDLPKELVETLRTEPLAKVKAIVEAMPRKQSARAATVSVPATQGSSNAPAPAGSPMERIDALMGMSASKSTSVVQTENATILGAPKGYSAPKGN